MCEKVWRKKEVEGDVRIGKENSLDTIERKIDDERGFEVVGKSQL